MQYTLFGKEIRKMMIERNLRVYDLAKEFDVSSAFISSILTGKKNFPQEWFGKIKIIFNLDDETIKSLMNLNEMSKDSIKIDLSNSNDFARETAFAFQRNLNNLDYESLLKLNDILNKKDGKKMVNDYETKPLSRNELRLYASIIRKRLNINTIKIPVIELMDILERDYNVEFIIEEDDSFDDGVMAYTYEDKDSHFVIKVRNSVYESACRGNAKCIGFICHEMCHFS